MAKIQPISDQKILQITKWTGLNESPDGDTGLKTGEAAEMRNFKVTREGHLQIRPGYGTYVEFPEVGFTRKVSCVWHGTAGGRERTLVHCGNSLFSLDGQTVTRVHNIGIARGLSTIFGYGEWVYIFTGDAIWRWNGYSIETVSGYIPLVATAVRPDGYIEALPEEINLLTPYRRVQFSPDGTATVFRLPEKTSGISWVELNGASCNGHYTRTDDGWTITLDTAPPEGTCTLEVCYAADDYDYITRNLILNCRYAETYGGGEGRVFLYGNGDNVCYYCGINGSGQVDPTYFPSGNEVAIGGSNTPITGLIRHYDRLLVYKPDGAWSMEYTTVTLADGKARAAFKVVGVNREVGNEAPGQVRLVENNPRTLYGNAVYDWPLSNSAIRDERNAKRVSDRVTRTLSRFKFSQCITYDDNENQEYYIVYGSEALVHNYGCDAWYYYTDVPMTCLFKMNGTLYFGTTDGRLMEFSRKYRNSDLRDIDAYWESGSMAFGREWMRKYSAQVWVGIMPETQAVVNMTAESNIKSDYPDKVIASGLSNFTHASFTHWSFGTNRKPQVIRAKLKVKKATFYKLIFYSASSSATATILSVDVQLRYTGNVK